MEVNRRVETVNCKVGERMMSSSLVGWTSGPTFVRETGSSSIVEWYLSYVCYPFLLGPKIKP